MKLTLETYPELFDKKEIWFFNHIGFENKLQYLVDESYNAQEWLEEYTEWFFDKEWREKAYMSEDDVIADGIKQQKRKEVLDYFFHCAV